MKVTIERIMYTTDFSDCANAAVRYGVSLAQAFAARLYVCHIIDIPDGAMYGEGALGPLEQQERITDYAHEYITRLMGDEHVSWEAVITRGHASDEIPRVARERGVDLVIAATPGHTGLKGFILGSVTQRLMKTLHCPMLVVRTSISGADEPGAHTPGFKRILVGCDFSPYSDLAVHYGLHLAQEFESELHLIHVIEPPLYRDLSKPGIKPGDDYQKDLRARLKEKLSLMIPEEACVWCTPKTALLAGHPHDELTKYSVINDIDLIILGLRGQKLMESLFVGSTTDRVVRQAPCPVLSVRPTGPPPYHEN